MVVSVVLTEFQETVLRRLLSIMDDYGNVSMPQHKFFSFFKNHHVGETGAALRFLFDNNLTTLFSYEERGSGIIFSVIVKPQGRAYFDLRKEQTKLEKKEHRRLFLSNLVTGVIMLVLGFVLGKLDVIISWLAILFK
jgi:hypothetical protein